MRMPQAVQPGDIRHSDRLHDKRVAFPVTDSMPKEGWRSAVGMFSSVEINGPPVTALLENHDNGVRRLYQFPGIAAVVEPRHARRQAVREWIDLVVSFFVGIASTHPDNFISLRRPRSER